MEGLVERGRSSWYVRDGLFCLSLAVAMEGADIAHLVDVADVDVPG